MLLKKNILSHRCSYLENWLLAEESCNFLYFFTSSVEFQNTLLGVVRSIFSICSSDYKWKEFTVVYMENIFQKCNYYLKMIIDKHCIA